VPDAAALLDTLPAPSTDGADNGLPPIEGHPRCLYHIADVESPQQWVEILMSSLGRYKASRQRTITELPAVGTAFSPAQVPTHLQQGNPSRHLEPLTCHQARRGDEGARSEHSARNPHRGGHNDQEGHSLNLKGTGPKVFKGGHGS
jgi:hypothetical protein